MRTWMLICLALGALRRTPLRVALTSLGVAIAAGALVSMVAFAVGLQRMAEAPFEKLDLLNNIQVTPQRDEKRGHGPGHHDGHDPDDPDDAPAAEDVSPGPEGGAPAAGDAPVLDDAALERFKAIPGVVLAYPDFRASGIEVTCGEKSETVLAIGLPREASLVGILSEVLVAGEFFSLGESPQAILSERLSEELGFASPEAAVGSQVTLKAAGLSSQAAETFRFERKEFTVQVVGVYSMPRIGPAFVGGILLPVEMMKEIPGIQFAPALERLRAGGAAAAAGYQRVTVRVRRPAELPGVEEAIRQMGFQTRTLLSDLEEMRRLFVLIDVLLASVGTVALVVAGLGIVNTLLMSVLERYQEIGIFKAIGASNGDLVVLFLTEAGLIGLFGGLGGLALGRAVSWGIELVVNIYARHEGVTTSLAMFAFPTWLLAGTVGFAIAISVLSGVYPALRAARVDPIRALRRE